MMLATLLQRLRDSRRGAAALEFALIAPLLLTMLLGVFQIGIGMQNYNALRAISGDMARYAVVNYQTGNQLTNDAIRFHGRSIATRAPYSLGTSRVTFAVTDVATPRLAGTTEKTIQIRYDIPSFLSVIGMSDIPVTFTRTVVLQS